MLAGKHEERIRCERVESAPKREYIDLCGVGVSEQRVAVVQGVGPTLRGLHDPSERRCMGDD